MSVQYLAGLFDGEGSFSVSIMIHDRPNGHGINITPLTLTYGQEVLNVLQNTFKGSIVTAGNNKESKKWTIYKREHLLFAAETLLPYLIIKKNNCQKFINILGLFPSFTHRWGESWTKDNVTKVVIAAYDLNHSGIHYKRTLNETLSLVNAAFDKKKVA